MKIEGGDIAELLRLLAIARIETQEYADSTESDDWEIVSMCGETMLHAASDLIGFLTRLMHNPASWT